MDHVPRRPSGMRRTLQSAGRAITGGRPVLSLAVIGAAAATAALQSDGVDEWWLLPLATLAVVTGFLRRGR